MFCISLVFVLILGSVMEGSQFFRSHQAKRWEQGDEIQTPSILIIRDAEHEVLDDKEPILSKALITENGRSTSQKFGEHLRKKPLTKCISCPASNCLETIKEIMKSAGMDETNYLQDKLLSYTSFYKLPERVADLIKEFGRKEFDEEFLEYWLEGAPAEFLHPRDEHANYILNKYSTHLNNGKGITLMVSHGFTIEALARAAGLGWSNWSKPLEGIIITRKYHQEM